MFKEMKYAKLLLVALTAYMLFPFKYHVNLIVREGYTDKLSVEKTGTLKVYLDCKDKNRRGQFFLYDIRGNARDSVIASGYPQSAQGNDQWKNGLGYAPTFEYEPGKLESGVYLWHKFIPFVLKGDGPSDITVVVPFANNQAENNFGGKSFFGYNSTNGSAAETLSVERPCRLDPFTSSFIPWVDSLFPGQNYIADTDLDNFDSYKSSKLLVLYGNVSFVSQKARENLENFVSQGGNLLILTSNIMNNIWKVKPDNTLAFIAKGPQHTYIWNDAKGINKPGCITTGCQNIYDSLPFAPFAGYKIVAPGHPVLEGVNTDLISFPEDLYSAPPLLADQIRPDAAKLPSFRSEIIAYGINHSGNPGAFFMYKRSKESGYIINTGCLNWTLPAQLKNPAIGRIITNSIRILTSGKEAIPDHAI